MKKRLVWLTTALLAATSAAARDLEDILKQKQVIDAIEANEAKAAKEKAFAEVAEKPAFQYKEGTGFVFVTPDKKFELDIGGRFQFRYTFTDVDGDYKNASRRVVDNHSFDVPRARIWFKGKAFVPDLGYEVQIDVASTGGGDVLRDGFLEYQLLEQKGLLIKAGQFKIPFCRQELTSSGRQEFVDRSLACSGMRFERDKGLQLYGMPMNSLIEYYVGAFNGTGRNNPLNPDTNFTYAGRLVTNPLGPVPYAEGDLDNWATPRFALGGGAGWGKYRGDEITSAATTGPDPNDDTKRIITTTGAAVTRIPPILGTIQPAYNSLLNVNDVRVELANYGGDFTLRWMGFSLTGEYFRAHIENDFKNVAAETAAPFKLPPDSFDAWGYYAQAGYFVIPKKFQVGVRYSELTPNDEARVTRPSGGTDTPKQKEFLGALGYYFSAHNLKLQSDFGPIESEGVRNVAGDIDDRKDWRVRVQAQLIF